MNAFTFTPASTDESIVFSAEGPAWARWELDLEDRVLVERWVEFMRQPDNQIERVTCLLTVGQLADYKCDLLAIYREAFGPENVCWVAVEDFHLCDQDRLLDTILPFLADSAQAGKRTVVHCSAGIGRSAHVLAAWLVYGRGFEPAAALTAVAENGRDPWEAIRCGNATEQDLLALLSACQRMRH